MNYLVGEPILPTVAQSIRDRQKIFEANDGLLREAYIRYQSLVPWVRLSSSVKVKANSKTAERFGSSGYELAKNNILFTLFDKETDGLQGYEKTQLGYRPAPGIQDMQIHSHNRFGSLRTAVVRFQCWSKEQLDILELLYMRPGYTLFLEWGWSGYLVNDNGNYTVDTLVSPIDFTTFTTREAATAAILKKRSSYNYHYDGIAGFVKNFSWSLRADGGYDCSTHIITAGDVAESLKVNFFISQEYIEKRNEIVRQRLDEAADSASGETWTDPSGQQRQKLNIAYPTLNILKQPTSPIITPDFTKVADTQAGQEAQALYDEFKARVENVLKYKGYVTSGRVAQTSPIVSVTQGLFMNPEARMFSFAGGITDLVPGRGDGNFKGSAAVIKKAVDLLVDSNSAELEVLYYPTRDNEFAVLRFKN